MIVRISMALHARLIALAAADPGREVCGLLLGRGERIEAVIEARNVAADPARRFEIDPRVQIDAAKAGRSGGLPVIGCYHSHPGGMAVPSATDLALAEPGSLWLIIAGDCVAAWRRGNALFAPMELHIDPRVAPAQAGA